MPVNMDPTKRRRKSPAAPKPAADPAADCAKPGASKTFGDETETDRLKALAEAESKNLWDATEVIDMDKW
ncbi:MAG TPA: hypothetical protein VEI50_01105 [Nitrospiraceae bacterium]|jgi:hypothetical protein|nr:hypothetical protein [Nitrospiraceae bacterium]